MKINISCLGIHFDCPVIGVTTFGVSFWTNFITRTPYPTSYVPNLFTSYSDNMSFSQRFFNTFIWISEEFLWHYLHYPKQVELYKKFFPQNKPELIEAIKNVALILNNNHFSTSTIKPSVPNVIDIGGICVQPAKELPKEFQEFLDSATEGAILFSMGSCIQAVDWPINKREIFVRVFSKLKQKVIWKYENETLPNKPDNVMISPWIPQRDILAHPNVKMFISHGGLLGTNEAIFEAVPILGIPIYGDQRMNMKVVNEKGLGLKLDFHTFNENDLIKALDEILNGSEISNKAKEFSTIYRDRPMTPQETAVYWVEYVIKHKGAPHLRTTAWKLNYIEFYNIDVYMTMLISFLSFLFLIKFAICKILLLKVWRLKNKVKKQ
ncbi:hypothetical protein PVAND_002724 [Polypedilum vanderplanki]|uniref:UDP-glucuronosyltransferase n=1 Tax=Polypedilum vanderplanki TaxID=319348 RepID=A0A9J6BRV0_POLVA|nr:hypothetical protein PVAND_002724 [Polypedilum vanderplanki]